MVYIKFEIGFGKNKRKMQTGSAKQNATAFAQSEAQRVRDEGKHKTAANYLTAVNSYSQFAECTDWCLPTSQPPPSSNISDGCANVVCA